MKSSKSLYLTILCVVVATAVFLSCDHTSNDYRSKSSSSDIRNERRFESLWYDHHIVWEKVSNKEYKLTVDYNEDLNTDISRLEIIVPSDSISKYGFEAIAQYLYSTTKHVRRIYPSGKVFYGDVKYILDKKGKYAAFELEGEMSFSNDDISNVSIHRFDTTSYVCVVNYRNNKYKYTKEEFYIDNAEIDKYGFWNIGHYKPKVRKCSFKNGDIVVGKIKYCINESTGEWIDYTITDGILYYYSGDMYTGSLDGNWCCGLPVEGTMTFADGMELKGNWLEKYRLSENEVAEITKIDSPSDKRDKAEQYYYTVWDESTNINYSNVNKNPKMFLDYFDEQFIYYAFHTTPSSTKYLDEEHDYREYTLEYGLFYDETTTLDNLFNSHFRWDLDDNITRPSLRLARRLISSKLPQSPKDLFLKQNYTDDYLEFLRICENFIRDDMSNYEGYHDKFEESFCARLWRHRLRTFVSPDEYENVYETTMSYNVFLEYGAVAMLNYLLLSISQERDDLKDSDYMYK